MPTLTKANKQAEFLRLAGYAEGLESSFLAGDPRALAPSAIARDVAQGLIGGLPGRNSDCRVDRLATKLDRLMAADRSPSSRRANGG